MSLHDRATGFLTVDLDAITANWRAIAARVGDGVETSAVVKADSYGLGAAKVAPALAAAGCRTFFVATIDEGMAIRALLPQARINVLGGVLPGSEDDLLAHDLIPTLNSLEQIKLWRHAAMRRGRRLSAALHVDTGMSRLGLDQRDVARLAENPAWLEGVDVALTLSHMACADEDGHAKNPEQRDLFSALCARLGLTGRRSLAASSAIFLGADYHHDLVRPGAALYGLNPIPGQPNPMRGAVRLMGRVVQARDVDSPLTVGYGATHRVTGPGRIATVAMGYADGLFRSLGNRGFGFIDGIRVPVVGRISMDLTTFDVSAVPPQAAQAGALIELIGPNHSADELAAEAGTIGYEVLTALGSRFLRHYQGGAA